MKWVRSTRYIRIPAIKCNAIGKSIGLESGAKNSGGSVTVGRKQSTTEGVSTQLIVALVARRLTLRSTLWKHPAIAECQARVRFKWRSPRYVQQDTRKTVGTDPRTMERDGMETNTRRAAVGAAPVTNAPRATETPLPQKISLEQLRQQCIAAHQRSDWQTAIKGYQAYLQIKPDAVAIWSNLGAALRKVKQFQSAVNCYRRALELSPDDLTTKGNLANALKDLHRLDEAIALHQEVTAAKPNDVQALMNHACALREAGQFAEALDQLNRAQAIEPNNAGVEWERAQNLLYLGRYTEGFKAYEARWLTGDLPQKDFGCPQWQGEDITGKTILLHAEQGYGDTILAARFIPMVKARVGPSGKVILQCKHELHRLFKNVGADHLIKPEDQHDHIDLHCPLMSLMGALNILPATIPPPAKLHIPDEARNKFKSLFESLSLRERGRGEGALLKVGIVWSGSVTFANNDNRSASLKQFLPLAEIPKIRLYSLQKGPRQKELHELGASAFIQDLGSLCEDFADTAAAIEQLDVIVMTDSSVAHLAASLNKPVINLLQKVPYWLYTLEEKTTPWYPSMQFVRQKNPPNWSFVFDELRELLRNQYTTNTSMELSTLP